MGATINSGSPTPDVVIQHFEAKLHPKFAKLLSADPASPLGRLIIPAANPSDVLVLYNLSEKPITALVYRFSDTASDGKTRHRRYRSDSYFVDPFTPIIEPRSPLLITPSGTINEKLIDHVEAGGGFMGGAISISTGADREALEATFTIDLVLFADGEIAGPDPEKYAAEMHCRKRAGEFVAKQIRLAEAEQRDVTPVLAALVEMPCLRGDHTADWLKNFARRYLSRMRSGNSLPLEGALRHMESRPELPRFHRKIV